MPTKRLLYGLFLLWCCNTTGCPVECEDLVFLPADFPVTVTGAKARYAPGDTLIFSVDLPASAIGDPPLSEMGGLVVNRFFAWPEGSDDLRVARDRFTFDVLVGETVQPDAPVDEAHFVRFACPAGRCTFRQRVVLRETGRYLLSIEGSSFSYETEELCPLSSFITTRLEPVADLDRIDGTTPLRLPDGRFLANFSAEHLLPVIVE
ncbi:MAG: hypothetical protein AAFZ52_02350 [Bacteroidota bacterium]